MTLNFVTREELKTELREIRSDLRRMIMDFTTEIKDLQFQLVELNEYISILSVTSDALIKKLLEFEGK